LGNHRAHAHRHLLRLREVEAVDRMALADAWRMLQETVA
jgi:hypothetical protein